MGPSLIATHPFPLTQRFHPSPIASPTPSPPLLPFPLLSTSSTTSLSSSPPTSPLPSLKHTQHPSIVRMHSWNVAASNWALTTNIFIFRGVNVRFSGCVRADMRCHCLHERTRGLWRLPTRPAPSKPHRPRPPPSLYTPPPLSSSPLAFSYRQPAADRYLAIT